MKRWLTVGAITGAFGVAFAAFGEHALRPRLEPQMLRAFATGAQYQLMHALALCAAAFAGRGRAAKFADYAGWLFFVGILLFSGSLYVLALSGIHVIGAITPVGGVALILGWVMLAVAASKWEDA
jgi:uncharacterized membrane protein YgdD (TMEM256/DUF423 family)